MKVSTRRFNLFLALIGGWRCFAAARRSKKNKEVSALRVHIEANPDNSGTSQTVSVLRADPVLITIANEPILTEANIVAAKVIDAHGGFAIRNSI